MFACLFVCLGGWLCGLLGIGEGLGVQSLESPLKAPHRPSDLRPRRPRTRTVFAQLCRYRPLPGQDCADRPRPGSPGGVGAGRGDRGGGDARLLLQDRVRLVWGAGCGFQSAGDPDVGAVRPRGWLQGSRWPFG